MNSANSETMLRLGIAPTRRFFSTPPTNSDSVGMLITPKRRATSGFSSTFSFASVSLSSCSPAISSRTGATILHGPHHSAQKSTSTALSDWRTSISNVESVTVVALLIFVMRWGASSPSHLHLLERRKLGAAARRATGSRRDATSGTDNNHNGAGIPLLVLSDASPRGCPANHLAQRRGMQPGGSQSQLPVVAPESWPCVSSQRSASMAAAQPVP